MRRLRRIPACTGGVSQNRVSRPELVRAPFCKTKWVSCIYTVAKGSTKERRKTGKMMIALDGRRNHNRFGRVEKAVTNGNVGKKRMHRWEKRLSELGTETKSTGKGDHIQSSGIKKPQHLTKG